MSNPWQELFEDIRFENGNDYFYQSLNEEEEGGVSSAMVAQAVQKIKRIAKRDGVRIQVAMTTFFANTRLSPSERAAVRNKVAELGESYEIDENIQAIATGYKRADMNTARALGNAQMMQQRLDSQRNAQRNQAQQSKKRLTTGGAPTQYGEDYDVDGEIIQEKITAKTDIGAAIRDFRKSKSPQLAGRTKEERRKAAIAAVLQARRNAKNESFESFVEEKYGEKYEKNYKKTGKKSKDYDRDGTVEDEGDEYAGVKDRAIKADLKKKVLNNSFSDWRNDLNLVNEIRYVESPFVEIMPEQKASGDEDKKAANLRLKPKKSNVSEDTELAEQLAESLGGQLIKEFKVPAGTVKFRNAIVPSPRVRSTPQITPPKVRMPSPADVKKAPSIPTSAARRTTQVATQAAERGGTRLAGKTFSRLIPGLNVAMASADAAEKLRKGDVLGATLAGASAVPGPVGWAALGLGTLRDLTTPEKLPEPIKTPKKAPIEAPTVKPELTPQGQPQTQTTTAAKPTTRKVATPSGAAATDAKTQTKAQRQSQATRTRVGQSTPVTGRGRERRNRDELNLELPKTPQQSGGRIYRAVSL